MCACVHAQLSGIMWRLISKGQTSLHSLPDALDDLEDGCKTKAQMLCEFAFVSSEVMGDFDVKKMQLSLELGGKD